MPTAKIVSVILLIALIGSNAYWLYSSIDTGISYAHLSDTTVRCQKMLQVAVAVIPVAADPDSGTAEVINAAESASGGKSFDKNGLVWISGLGLGFDGAERIRFASSVPVDGVWRQP